MTRLPAHQVKGGMRVWPHYIGPWLDVNYTQRTTYNTEPAVMVDGVEQGGHHVEVYLGAEHVCWVETK
jgi:hypothetical protein